MSDEKMDLILDMLMAISSELTSKSLSAGYGGYGVGVAEYTVRGGTGGNGKPIYDETTGSRIGGGGAGIPFPTGGCGSGGGGGSTKGFPFSHLQDALPDFWKRAAAIKTKDSK